ncbi:MAG: tetratricopeptide repeat protein, partial [Candidatus Thorarchaeota archaeon]
MKKKPIQISALCEFTNKASEKLCHTQSLKFKITIIQGLGDGLGAENDLFQRSIAALAGGNPERAKQQILKLLEKDKNNLELLTFLTAIYQQYQQPQNGLQTAQRIAELEPDNPRHWNNLGYLYILLGRWEEAEKCYAKATKLDEAAPTVYLNYALSLIELGK